MNMDEDKELERIMKLTEAELRAEIIAEGRDPDIEIATCKSIFELALADIEFERRQRRQQ